MSSSTFKTDAIAIMGRVIRSREHAIRTNGSKVEIDGEQFNLVKNCYQAYRNRWTPAQLSKFITKHADDLRQFAIGGTRQEEEVEEIIERSKQITQFTAAPIEKPLRNENNKRNLSTRNVCKMPTLW